MPVMSGEQHAGAARSEIGRDALQGSKVAQVSRCIWMGPARSLGTHHPTKDCMLGGVSESRRGAVSSMACHFQQLSGGAGQTEPRVMALAG